MAQTFLAATVFGCMIRGHAGFQLPIALRIEGEKIGWSMVPLRPFFCQACQLCADWRDNEIRVYSTRYSRLYGRHQDILQHGSQYPPPIVVTFCCGD